MTNVLVIEGSYDEELFFPKNSFRALYGEDIGIVVCFYPWKSFSETICKVLAATVHCADTYLL